MGRFLTPSKIALLVLAQIYIKGLIPFASTGQVLRSLLSRILFDADASDRDACSEDDNSVFNIEHSLDSQPSIVPGRTIWDLLLKYMWAIDCADALEWFIADMTQYLSKTREELLKDRDEGLPPGTNIKIVRTSPLGLFIRRCAIEYMKPQFQESMGLWLEFVGYRMPTKTSFGRRNPQLVRNSFDSVLSDLDIDYNHPIAGILLRPLVENMESQSMPYSVYDSEKLMEFQVSEMQSFGGRLPDNMKARLKHMASMGTAAPKLVHYLKFLDSWRAGDFASAFDNLHRYFDYTMQSRDRTFYQYALLNLAILQADFGCHDEAIPAMQEAISTARENRDTVCLNYCMSWLYHFGRAFPSQMQSIREAGVLGDEVEGLSFLKSRAKEAQMWTLLSTSLLSEAKIALQKGDSLGVCFENIVKAAHVNIVKLVPNSTGPALLMKTTLFARIGQAHMARACGERFLLCHGSEAPLEDFLKCTVRQANLLAQAGRIKKSQTVLEDLPAHIMTVLKYKTYHTTSTLILRARRELHRGNLESATFLVERLVAQQPHPEVDTSTQVSLLHVDLLIRRKSPLEALKRVTMMVANAPLENTDVHLIAKLLLLKANLLAKSDSPLCGLSLVVRALDIAYSAQALPALWEAMIALSTILCATYEFTAAQMLVEAALPMVLECQDCELAGRALLVLADTYVGLAGFATKTNENIQERSNEQTLLTNKAMRALEKAGEQFRWIEDLDHQLEVLSKLGRIHAWRGDTELAAQMADKYAELKKEYSRL